MSAPVGRRSPHRGQTGLFSSIAPRALLVCILLATWRMPSTRRPIPALASAGVVLHLAAASAIAQPVVNDPVTPPPHVRAAGEPSIVDTATLAAFYARTARQTSDEAGRRTFETVAGPPWDSARGRNCCTSRRGTAMEHEHVVQRIREEFKEMPGLRLTPAQATKLWGLEHHICHAVIDALVAAAFLRWTEGGLVTRAES